MAARLGSVELEGPWRATYLLVHRTQGDFVALSLRDPEGVLRLERELPVQGGSCTALSRVIALVLERYFLRPEQATPEAPASLAVTTHEAAVRPSGVAAAPASQPAPAAREVTQPPAAAVEDAPAPSATAEPRHYRLSAALWATTSWLAPSLGLSRDLGGPYRLALNAGFDLSNHETRVFEGSASLRRAPLSLACERELRLGAAVSGDAGLEFLGIVEDARTNALAESGGGLRIVPGLGARLGARFFTDSVAQPFAQLTAAWLIRAATPEFRVADVEVLPPSALVLGLALGIGTPF